jgi:hypothetical protein
VIERRRDARNLVTAALGGAASQQTAHDPPQILGQRSGPVVDDSPVLHHHVDRLNAAVFPIEISRQIDVGILSEVDPISAETMAATLFGGRPGRGYPVRDSI